MTSVNQLSTVASPTWWTATSEWAAVTAATASSTGLAFSSLTASSYSPARSKRTSPSRSSAETRVSSIVATASRFCSLAVRSSAAPRQPFGSALCSSTSSSAGFSIPASAMIVSARAESPAPIS